MNSIVLTEQTLVFEYNSARGAYVNNSNPSLFLPVEGESYVVTWDGIDYSCVAFADSSFAGTVLLGNTLFLGGADTSEPFIFASTADGSGLTIFTIETTESHVISIQHEVGSDRTVIIGQQLLLGFTDHVFMYEAQLVELVPNTEYILFWDGTYYARTAFEASPGIYAVGNLALEDSSSENTGEPFLLGVLPAEAAGNETGMTLIIAETDAVGHHVAIYQAVTADEKHGADIILYDADGAKTVYEGADKVKFPTTDGGTQVYTCGQLPSVTPEITVDFATGDQTVKVDNGYLVREAILKKPEQLLPENIIKDVAIAGVVGQFDIIDEVSVPLNMPDGDQEAVAYTGLQAVKKVIVLKPETLIPDNIAKGIEIGGVVGSFAGGVGVHKDVEPDFSAGDHTVTPDDEDTLLESVTIKKPISLLPANIVSGVNIAGVVGEYEAPKLYKPTNVTGPTLNSSTGLYYYRVVNPTANNGAFVDTVQIRNASDGVTTEVPYAGVNTDVYAEDFENVDKVILTNIYASFAGAGFSPSDTFDTNANLCVIQVLDYDLSNVTLSKMPRHAFQQDKITLKATAASGFYLPKELLLSASERDTVSLEVEYDPDTGDIVLVPNTYNFMEGIITIGIIAVDTPWLHKPAISEQTGALLKVWYDENTEYLVISVDDEVVLQEEPVPTVSVPQIIITAQPDGAANGFKLGSDGYYVSDNYQIANSYAICRVDVITSAPTTLTLDCRSYGESNYDYGLISKVDTAFVFSNTSDSSYFKTFRGASSSSVVQVSYPVPAGEHFFYIKYRKDGSGNSGDDTFKFKISNATTSIAYIHNFDMSSLLSNYVTLNASIKAIATGYTDSDSVDVTINYMPCVSTEGKVLTITNLLDVVTAVQIYANDELIATVAKETDTVVFDCSELLTDQAVTYAIFVVATGEGVAENTSNTVEVSPAIYGVSGLYGSAAALDRTDDAVGMSYIINADGTVNSDFDSVFPWSAMEVVEDSLGNSFVQLPRMFFRVDEDSSHNITAIAVSAAPRAGEDNWYEVEPFCVGRYYSYKNGTVLQSISGVAPTGSVSRANFRTYSKNTGDNYHAYDVYHETVLKFLWWIEWATKDSSSVMTGTYSGTGTTGGTAVAYTGGTDAITTPSGYEPTRKQMRYHYIEDFVGNMSIWLDGVYSDYQSTVCRATADPTKFSDSSGTMTALCYSNPSNYTNACVSGYGCDANNPFLCMPRETVNNASYNTYFCDGYYNISYNSRPAPFARTYYYGTSLSAGSGLCALNRFSASSTYAYVGSRLIYRGTLK